MSEWVEENIPVQTTKYIPVRHLTNIYPDDFNTGQVMVGWWTPPEAECSSFQCPYFTAGWVSRSRLARILFPEK